MALRAPPRRAARWALAVLVVLAAHALLLWAWGPAWIDPGESPAPPPVMSVRSVLVVPAPSARRADVPSPAIAAPATNAPTEPRAAPRRETARMPLARVSSAAVAASAAALPPIEVGTQGAERGAPRADAASETASADQDAAAAPANVELPLYPARVAAAGRWRYAMQRGVASGEAVLDWQAQADGRYALRLEGTVAGLTVLDWASRGAIGAHGLEPERFALRRRGRDHQAANFQRDSAAGAKITFSGPTHELPLWPGVQDRLSWWMQLPAVLEAAPARLGVAGARVTLMVVGARGGAELWRFEVLGIERLDDVPALKLVRAARRPRETQVELWLDPARGHLPLRARLETLEGGPALELRLIGSTGP
jgi:Protein of unknown function (DUF3108)